MSDGVDWQFRADYIWERHGIRVAEANEALADPRRVRLNPDPASESKLGIRTIGRSPTLGQLISVITIVSGTHEIGVNAWKSNRTDLRKYMENL